MIVAGGITWTNNPWTMTRAVEVLHVIIKESWFARSYWSVVEQLPCTCCA